MHEEFHDQGLEIIGFPCNQFGGQEPWPEPEIKAFVEGLGVTFKMMSKIDVKGANESPVYTYLKETTGSGDPTWNFGIYYAVSRTGEVVVSGDSPQASLAAIQGFLAEEA